MKIRGRVKPSKPISAVAMIMGIVFVGIGVFVVIPSAGPFGVLWTLAALFIAGYHAYNLFSESGASHAVVDIDVEASPSRRQEKASLQTSVETRLGTLEQLKNKGLISEDGYAQQRCKILDGLSTGPGGE